MHYKRLILALLVALACALAPAGARAEVTQEGQGHAQTILAKVNELRASLGLKPVTRYVELDAVAQDWSEQMASRSVMEHRPDFANHYPAGWSEASENVAMHSDGGDIGTLLFEQWRKSPDHYKNMTNPDANAIGIGVAEGESGWYGTQNFAGYNDTSSLTVTTGQSPQPSDSSPSGSPSDASPSAPQPSTPDPSGSSPGGSSTTPGSSNPGAPSSTGGPSSQGASSGAPGSNTPSVSARPTPTPSSRPTSSRAKRSLPISSRSAVRTPMGPTVGIASSAPATQVPIVMPSSTMSAGVEAAPDENANPAVMATTSGDGPSVGNLIGLTGAVTVAGVAAAAFARVRRAPVPKRARAYY